MEELVTQAVNARCGLRWIEQYVSDLLSSNPALRRAPSPSPAEPPKRGKTPTSLADYKVNQEHLFKLLAETEHVVAHLQAQFARHATSTEIISRGPRFSNVE